MEKKGKSQAQKCKFMDIYEKEGINSMGEENVSGAVK